MAEKIWLAVRLAFNGFVIGITLALLLRLVPIIELLVRTGWFIPLGWLLVLAVFLFLRRKKPGIAGFGRKTTLFCTVVCAIVLLISYGWTRLAVVPASIIREVFNQMTWTLPAINFGLLLFTVGGFAAIMLKETFAPSAATLAEKKDSAPMSAVERRKAFAALGMIAAFMLLYLFVPAVKHFFDTVVSLLSRMDIAGLRDYIQSFGFWGPAISIVLMMFQSIAAPLPAVAITFANAYVFGWAFGALISWSGAMFGAILCFYISKFLGRPVVEKIVSKKALEKMDDFFADYGNYTIVILRLIPFVSFDVVSYAAGLTAMRLLPFLAATGIGQLPATIIYSFVGGNLGGSSRMLLYGLIAFGVLIAFSLIMKKILLNKKERRQETNGTKL